MLPASFTKSDPPGSTCLLSLVHRQELELQVEADGAKPDTLTGHLSQARWQALDLMAATLREALANAAVFEPQLLTERIALVRLGSKWNPALRLLVCGEVREEVLGTAWRICEVVLASVTKSAQERNNLELEFLDPQAQMAVREAVEGAIEQARGCSFAVPMLVHDRNGNEMTLSGKLGRKRDRSDHAAKPVDVTGRIGGYMNMHKSHYIIVQPEEGPAVQIDFLEEQLHSQGAKERDTLLDLVEIARRNVEGTLCTFRVHQTTDARGNQIHTFARLLDADGEI